MAMSLNRAQLIGNLTKDPEVRQTSSGQAVASFSIATNFTWNDQNGQKQEKTEFHSIVAWRKLAEICGQYLKKGSKVYIEGRIQTREWEGEDGVKRYRTEIVADNMIMLDRKDFGGSSERQHGGLETVMQGSIPASKQKTTAAKEEAMEEDVSLEDLPF